MEYQGILIAGVLLGIAVVMMKDLFHRTLAVVLGVLILGIFYRIPAQELFFFIRWDSIFFLFSLALVAAVLHRSGLFSWLVLRTAQRVKAQPGPLIWALSSLSLVAGGFLGGVPGMILLIPVTILLVVELGLDPGPFLLVEVWGTTLGALVTPFADPLSVLLGAHFHLSVWEYLRAIPLAVLGVWLLGTLVLWLGFRRTLQVSNERKARILEFQAQHSIVNPRLLAWGLTALAALVFGITMKEFLSLDLSLIGLTAASLLLIILGPQEMEKTLAEVRGGPLIFLASLMILAGLVNWQGWLDGPFRQLIAGIPDPRWAALGLLWLTSLASALVGALPVVILGLPWLDKITLAFTDVPGIFLWPFGLALVLGAALGSFTHLGWGPGAAAQKETQKTGVPWNPKPFRSKALTLSALGLVTLSPILYFCFPGAL